MNVTIRMISIATTILWVFLILFAVSAAFSAKDLQFDFGEPKMMLIPDNKLLLSLPMNVKNKGYYNIGMFNLTTEVLSTNSSAIARDSTVILAIRRGDFLTVLHNMTLDVNDLTIHDKNYLFNDTQLNIVGTVGMELAEIIPVQLSTNFSISWGAPLNNLTIGEPRIEAYNLTHIRVTISVRFENHAPFDFAGKMQMTIYDSSGLPAGSSETDIEVSQRSPYSRNLEVFVIASSFASHGYFKVEIQTPLFNHTSVIPYG